MTRFREVFSHPVFEPTVEASMPHEINTVISLAADSKAEIQPSNSPQL